LRADGLAPIETIPAQLAREEIESAQRIVSFCPLPDEYLQGVVVEYWDGIPPVGDDYQWSRDAILTRLEELINRL
jgi:hypothetical protein